MSDSFTLMSALSFMLVTSLVFTLCYIAKEWWLFLLIMVLYVILQGIKQYDNNKMRVVKAKISDGWKAIFIIILLMQVGQIMFLGIIIYSLPENFIEVAIKTFVRFDENNMVDKSIRVFNYFDASIPFNCYNIMGGDCLSEVS